MKIKDDLHLYIDSINDEALLKSYYQLIQKINNELNFHLWNGLSDDEKKELLLAYDESFDSNNLISHEQVKLQHSQWLKHNMEPPCK